MSSTNFTVKNYSGVNLTKHEVNQFCEKETQTLKNLGINATLIPKIDLKKRSVSITVSLPTNANIKSLKEASTNVDVNFSKFQIQKVHKDEGPQSKINRTFDSKHSNIQELPIEVNEVKNQQGMRKEPSKGELTVSLMLESVGVNSKKTVLISDPIQSMKANKVKDLDIKSTGLFLESHQDLAMKFSENYQKTINQFKDHPNMDKINAYSGVNSFGMNNMALENGRLFYIGINDEFPKNSKNPLKCYQFTPHQAMLALDKDINECIENKHFTPEVIGKMAGVLQLCSRAVKSETKKFLKNSKEFEGNLRVESKDIQKNRVLGGGLQQLLTKGIKTFLPSQNVDKPHHPSKYPESTGYYSGFGPSMTAFDTALFSIRMELEHGIELEPQDRSFFAIAQAHNWITGGMEHHGLNETLMGHLEANCPNSWVISDSMTGALREAYMSSEEDEFGFLETENLHTIKEIDEMNDYIYSVD